MKRIFLLAAFLLQVVCAFAQEENPCWGPYAFEANTRQYIFSDTAFVRSAPGAVVQDTLFAFETITVKKQLAQRLTIGRKDAPWYEVSYSRKGKKKTGVLWGGAMSIRTSERDGHLFSFGVLSYPQPPTNEQDKWPEDARYNTCAIKMKEKAGTIQQCFYNIGVESAGFIDSYTDDSGHVENPRFQAAGVLPVNAKFLVSFMMSGEACAIPTYEIKAAWDGEKLIRMPMLEYNADGGVWAYDEEYIYPNSKGGKPGMLIVKGTSKQYKEEGNETVLEKTTVDRTLYRWDNANKEFVQQKRVK